MEPEYKTNNEAEQPRQPERKYLELDWTESEWFQVWLELARRNHDDN